MQKLTDGFLKETYESCFRHFLYGIDPQIHENAYVGEHTENGFAESEFAGKYMDVCAHFYRYTKDQRILSYAKRVADSVVKNLRDDGYIGGYERGREWAQFSVWNQAFTVIGLLSVWEITEETRYLDAAERCAEYIARHFLDTDDHILNAQNNGSQHLAILVPMAMLYAKTQKAVYRDFWACVLKTMDGSDNDFTHFESILDLRSKKAIENFCCLIGLELYAQKTQDPKLCHSIRQYWQEVKETQICETGNGSMRELWQAHGNAPSFRALADNPNETCVAVGWAELSVLLFEREKKAEYLDEIEKTLFNHLLGALDAECSDFGYYQPNFGSRITRTAEDVYKCCRYRGFSAISRLPEHLFYTEGNTVIPMIYANAVYENGDLSIREETEYPYDGKIKWTISGSMTLKLRIPGWCQQYSICKNGKQIDVPVKDGFAELVGEWENDEILLDLHTQPRCKAVEIDGVSYVGMSYGCLVCALNCSEKDEILQASIDPNAVPERVFDSSYPLKFSVVGHINGEARKLELVNYSSAGKRCPTDEYTVWIQAERQS